METTNEIRIEKIKKIIGVLNLNQSEFANRMEVSRSYISRVLGGNPTVSDNFINKICNVFGISKEYFNNEYGVENKVIFQENTQVVTHTIKNSTVSPFTNSIFSQIEDLIIYRGENNIYFQKDMSNLLHHIKNYLVFKDNFKDPEEGIEKSDSWLDDIIDILQRM